MPKITTAYDDRRLSDFIKLNSHLDADTLTSFLQRSYLAEALDMGSNLDRAEWEPTGSVRSVSGGLQSALRCTEFEQARYAAAMAHLTWQRDRAAFEADLAPYERCSIDLATDTVTWHDGVDEEFDRDLDLVNARFECAATLAYA